MINLIHNNFKLEWNNKWYLCVPILTAIKNSGNFTKLYKVEVIKSDSDWIVSPTEKRASSTEQTLLGIPEQCFKEVYRTTNGARGCSLH